MTVVVGFGPDVRSVASLRLAGQLAHASSSDVVLCCVVHDAFDMASLRDAHDVDAEWSSHLEAMAREALVSARRALPDDVPTETVTKRGRSVPEILRQEGKRRKADLLVVGSASIGNVGRIALGSTTERLVHGSDIPVALAPQGYPGDTPLRRLVVAIEPTRGDVNLSDRIAATAKCFNLPVRIVTFLVRQRSAAGAFAERGVLAAWRDQVSRAHTELTRRLTEAGVEVEGTGVPEGERWSAAVQGAAWQSGDLLVVGSSAHGPLASVFLGSTATRILRTSPVPVVVLPR